MTSRRRIFRSAASSTRQLFRRDGVMRGGVELGQPEHENFGRRFRFEYGFLAPFAEHRGVVAISVVAGPPVAGEHEIDLAAGSDHSRLRGKAQKARLATPLGEDAHQLLAYAWRALDWHPFEMLGMHHDGVLVARGRIGHRPLVHVLPDRLIAVGVAFAVLAGVAAEDALLER